MSAQLRENMSSARAVVPVPVPTVPPPGFWTREASHAPQPRTPFTAGMLIFRDRGIRQMCDELGLLFETLDVRSIGGWEYVRIVPLGGKQPPPLPGWLVPLVFRVVPSLRRRIRHSVAAIRSDVPGGLIRRWGQEWQPDLAARTAALREIEPAGLDDAGLEKYVAAVLALGEHGVAVHFRLHGALAVVLGELAFICRDQLGWDAAKVSELLAGTSRMSTAPARALAEAATIARQRPALRRLVEDGAPAGTVLAADQGFAEAIERYQREFGCRALRYELAEPCLDERPDLVLALVRGQLVTGFDPAVAEADLNARRAEVRAEALRLLDGRGTAVRHRFEAALERALLAYPVREDNEFFTISGPLALGRRVGLEFGRRLTSLGLLDRADDAFLLDLDELRAAMRDHVSLRDLVRHRAGEREWVLAHPGPSSYGTPPGPPPPMSGLPPEARLVNEAFLWVVEQVFGSPAEPALADAGPASADAGPTGRETEATTREAEATTLEGVAVSPGSYTGPARIICGEDEFDRLQPGDVLVCPATCPVWSVLFAGIGALVADFGGALSHQAIIAREYGIPAVVGTREGTSRLTDGQTVTVDGTTGSVRVIS